MVVQNKKGEILLTKRAGNRAGSGLWNLVGEKCKNGETFEQTAIRGLKEEVGLTAEEKDIKIINVSNIISTENIHLVHIGVLITNFSGTPVNMEPEKCSEIKWCNIKEIPGEFFIGSKSTLNLFLANKFYDTALNYNYKLK